MCPTSPLIFSIILSFPSILGNVSLSHLPHPLILITLHDEAIWNLRSRWLLFLDPA